MIDYKLNFAPFRHLGKTRVSVAVILFQDGEILNAVHLGYAHDENSAYKMDLEAANYLRGLLTTMELLGQEIPRRDVHYGDFFRPTLEILKNANAEI